MVQFTFFRVNSPTHKWYTDDRFMDSIRFILIKSLLFMCFLLSIFLLFKTIIVWSLTFGDSGCNTILKKTSSVHHETISLHWIARDWTFNFAGFAYYCLSENVTRIISMWLLQIQEKKEIKISKVKIHSTDLLVFFLLGIWNFIQVDCIEWMNLQKKWTWWSLVLHWKVVLNTSEKS